jgi:hypothetical protein
MNRGLRLAFDINTFLTFMAFVLLVVKPTLLPAAVGVHPDSTGYFNIVFHVSSAAVMVTTFATGGSDFPLGLWVNVLVPRLGISVMCAYFGLARGHHARRTRVQRVR